MIVIFQLNVIHKPELWLLVLLVRMVLTVNNGCLELTIFPSDILEIFRCLNLCFFKHSVELVVRRKPLFGQHVEKGITGTLLDDGL